MQAGAKNRRVTIQSPPVGKNTNGDINSDWVDVCTVWASHVDLSGRELIAAQAKYSQVTAQFEIRYRSAVVSSMRVLFNGAIYDIGAVLDLDGRRKELKLLCSTGLNNG